MKLKQRFYTLIARVPDGMGDNGTNVMVVFANYLTTLDEAKGKADEIEKEGHSVILYQIGRHKKRTVVYITKDDTLDGTHHYDSYEITGGIKVTDKRRLKPDYIDADATVIDVDNNGSMVKQLTSTTTKEDTKDNDN